MYCGDETGAFVGDVGHSTSRFGYGGEDCPKSTVPSWTVPSVSVSASASASGASSGGGLTCPGSTLRVPSSLSSNDDSDEDLVPIFDWSQSGSVNPNDHLNSSSSGLVQNWDAYEHVWSDAFRTLRVSDGRKHTTGRVGRNPDEESKCIHPILSVDCGYTCHGTREARKRDVEPKPKSDRPPVDPLTDVHADGPPDLDDRLRLQQRGKVLELLFEKFDAPAVFLAPSPMLAAFAHGRQTALVVDVGGSGSRVTPVVDGLVLRSAQRRSGRGGEWLGAVQARALTDFGGVGDVVPRYALGPAGGGGGAAAAASGGRSRGRRRPVVHGPQSALRKTLFHRVAMADLMHEMLTGPHVTLQSWREDLEVPFVGYPDKRKKRKRNDGDGTDDEDEGEEAADPGGEEDEDAVEGTTYSLPDGTRVDLAMSKAGKDLCRLPELLYSDEIPFVDLSGDKPPLSAKSVAQSTLTSLPLHRLTHASLTAVGDGDARKDLCSNILLTGAASLFPNMETRLSYEISNVAPSAYKCKVVASRNTIERRYAPWIGGSILTSLGSFQQLWLSRAEYEEYGPILGGNRFP